MTRAIGDLLQRATDAGDVPGVAAIAAKDGKVICPFADVKTIQLFQDFEAAVYRSILRVAPL